MSGNSVQGEMHIAMQADRLGAVEVHARVSGEILGAAITVEKKEAHTAMAIELPSLQQALQERQLRVSSVVLMESATHSNTGDAGNTSGEQRRGQGNTPWEYPQTETEAMFGAIPGPILEGAAIFDGNGRLSVLA
jgi:flagellar hook-length control protein FliK